MWRKTFDDEYDVEKFNKLSRLRWAAQVIRMEESDPAMKVLCTKPGASGERTARPKLRLCDKLEDNVAWVGC
jgi:hypothetical protein